MKYVVSLILIFSFVILFAQNATSPNPNKNKIENKKVTKKITKENRDNYNELLSEIKEKKEEFFIKYTSADSTKKEVIINSAQNYVINTLVNDIFPKWYGTTWAYNGTTKTPNKGKIACGYFVTRTLEAVGFELPVFNWAQKVSAYMIKKMSKKEQRNYSTNLNFNKFKNRVRKMGDGLYVVGLDCHIGYIYNKNDKMTFIHSSFYRPPSAVIAESIDSDNPLKNSKIRFVGKICNKNMIKKWILGENLDQNVKK